MDDGLPLGAATPEWDDETAARNPAGLGGDFYHSSGSLRRWVRGGFGLLALAGFVGVLWYAYEWGLGGGETVELPTVRAEAGPEKVKPADPGGLQVPYQDQLVLNQGEAAGPRVERLLPPPEAPLPAPELAGIAPSYDEPVDALPLEGEAVPTQPAGEPDTGEGQAFETVPELPAAPSAQSAKTETAGAEQPVAEPAAPEPSAPEPSAPEPAAPQAVASEPQATTTQTAAAPATQAAPASGDFAVQLVSLKNRGAAEAEWRRLQGVFPTLLGDKSLLLQSAEVAGVGTVYRLRAGPFATKAKAAQVCAQLKSRQQDCLVVSR
ncbi:MAG: SPOR domain-containing protein [Kiloniellales bacterium]|nr:SPOR domain-containing protein [Kiloniellales bacterium]